MSEDMCTSTKQVFEVVPGGEERSGAASVVLLLILVIAGATAGTEVTFDAARRIWKNDRLAFVSGMVCQFGFMPTLGLFLSLVVSESDAYCNESSLRLGVLLPCFMPGHAFSAVLCIWVGGNVDLSILMSLVSNTVALFAVPLLILLFYETRFNDTHSIKMPYGKLLVSLVLNFVGVGIGIAIRRYAPPAVPKWVKKIGGAIVVLVILVAFVSVVREMAKEDDWVNKLTTTFWLTGLTVTPVGTFVGLILAKFAFRLDVKNSLTVSIETGIQSTSLQAMIVLFAFDTKTEKRIVSDLIINGCLGPMFFFLFHMVWIVALHYFINAKFGTSKLLDSDAAEDVANGNKEGGPSKIGCTEDGTTVVADTT